MFFRHVSKSPKLPPPTISKSPKFPPPTVNLGSESDEEVVVDDFDGQCCRTYPDNHSRIIKWRAQRIEKTQKQKATVITTNLVSSTAQNQLTYTKTTTQVSKTSTTSVIKSSLITSSTLPPSRKPQDSGSKSKDGPPTSGKYFTDIVSSLG